jgi:peroxiredoxin/uncharacterized membrane protein YphA (DoxX/SURF4 family)
MAVLSVPAALLVLRVVLAAVLAWSGLAKLTDRAGFRIALDGFALPAGLARPTAVVLPVAELAAAAALVPAASAWWAAVAALVLLLAFTVVLVVTLARGLRPECHCFGAFSARPISWRTVARNGILVAAAAVLVAPGPGASRLGLVAEAGRLSAAALAGLAVAVVLVGVAVAQGWVIVQLLRQQGRMLLRLDALEAAQPGRGAQSPPGPASGQPNGHARGLAIGSPAPQFTLHALDGPATSLRDLLAAGRPVVLAFADPGCGSCTELLPELARWRGEHASRLTLAVISTGTAGQNRKTAARYGPGLVLLQQDREVSNAYAVHGTPALVAVGADGRISSHVAAGATAVRALLAQLATGRSPHANGHGAVHQIGPAPASSIGAPAPPVQLPDLAGNLVDLAGYRGHPALLLFWNPACGFCQKMLADLRAWEAGRTQDAPQLLVVSTGTTEANQALGLASPVLLDTGFSTGRAFGAGGTPSAVLVDEDGRIACDLAVGGPAVMALAAGQAPAWDRST